MKKMILIATSILLGFATQSVSARGSSFGSSFGGGLLGGFVGSTVSNAMTQPRSCQRVERVVVEKPVYVERPATRYVEVHHHTTERVPQKSRMTNNYHAYKQQAEEEKARALEAEARYEEAHNRALKAEQELEKLKKENKKLEVGLLEAKQKKA